MFYNLPHLTKGDTFFFYYDEEAAALEFDVRVIMWALVWLKKVPPAVNSD